MTTENGYIDDIYGWDFTDAPNLQAEGDYLEGDNEPIDGKRTRHTRRWYCWGIAK